MNLISPIKLRIQKYKAQRNFENSMRKAYFSKFDEISSFFDNYPAYIDDFKRYPKNYEHLTNYFLKCIKPHEVVPFFSFINKHKIELIDMTGNNLLIKYCQIYERPLDYSSFILSPSQDFRNERNKAFPAVLRELLTPPLINIDYQNSNGLTALMILVRQNQYEMASLLLDLGANPLIRSNQGFTALEIDSHGAPELDSIYNTKINDYTFFIDKLKSCMERRSLSVELSPNPSSLAKPDKPRNSNKI